MAKLYKIRNPLRFRLRQMPAPNRTTPPRPLILTQNKSNEFIWMIAANTPAQPDRSLCGQINVIFKMRIGSPTMRQLKDREPPQAHANSAALQVQLVRQHTKVRCGVSPVGAGGRTEATAGVGWRPSKLTARRSLTPKLVPCLRGRKPNAEFRPRMGSTTARQFGR